MKMIVVGGRVSQSSTRDGWTIHDGRVRFALNPVEIGTEKIGGWARTHRAEGAEGLGGALGGDRARHDRRARRGHDRGGHLAWW